MSPKGSWIVGVPIYSACTLLDFAGATQIFSPWVAAGFESVWLAPSRDPVRTTEGVQVLPSRCFDDPGVIDVLFVPGGGKDVGKVMQDPVYVDFVRRAGQAAHFAGAVCTGAFILAAAGLLDDCEATTYWSQPPFDSGDPATAPPEVTTAVHAGQQQFIASIRKATLEVIGRS